MEVTPQETYEDSGCLTGTFDSSSVNCDYSLTHTLYAETPTIPSSFSRKRKITHRFSTYHLYASETSSVANNIGTQANFLSSTLNESLSRSLEKCVIGNTPSSCLQFTPIDLDSEQSLKRYKLDNSPEYRPKTRSAPTTPTKPLDSSDLNFPFKSESDHLDYKSSEKKKSFRKYTKLGSPERLELLYPNLKLIQSPLKLKTPEKLREFIKKINSPAKKRLFETTPGERKIVKKVDCDPISVFLIKNDFRHIVSKIFSYLSDSDLCIVSRVSKSWKRALTGDYEAFPRYYAFYQKYNVNKENLTPVPLPEKSNVSNSPEQDYFNRYRKVAAQLTPSQSLQKCLQCMQPSVIEKSISQCQNPNCQYIYCIKCLCFSTSGPENFIDKCRTSELIMNESKSSYYYGRLNDISNIDPIPSFLVNESFDKSQTKHDSSGYLSESDFSPVVKRNVSFSMDMKRFQVLQEVNRNTQHPSTLKRNRRSSLFSVISSNSTPKVDLIEPSSPPKVKVVACSKQSKKNLKRLQF